MLLQENGQNVFSSLGNINFLDVSLACLLSNLKIKIKYSKYHILLGAGGTQKQNPITNHKSARVYLINLLLILWI